MNKINIDKKRDTIIVEKINGNSVEYKSNFYCGCCGYVLGVSNKKLRFPFSIKEFNDSLIKKTFTINKLGLTHNSCNHTMFTFKNGYHFISLDNYKKVAAKPNAQLPASDS